MTNTWNIWLVVNKVIHSTASVARNRTWQIDQKTEEIVTENGVTLLTGDYLMNPINKVVVKRKKLLTCV
jgi:hypothetical protein